MAAVISETSSNPVALERFRRDLGELWNDVAPLCHSTEDPAELVAALHAQDGTVHRALPDLEALLAGWRHYDTTSRAILTGAVTYVTETTPTRDGAVAGAGETVGGHDGEVVVDAAIRAILRRR
ncbi:hypothetical protein [Mobilicoccus pelagius]|uniref:Uncharacterized protein n=1 Tax=Mobilicoccus pelagius NBRC 104925 TaxID=1089455 RepID=H5UNQ0_9MICO|nr:hypothetical protein [Mobilicoccus pelagius]GAB47358.1 hypothetical protein MOPEL_009_00480 [Mobilicoccus pelagius NBRC 104925]